MKNIKSLEKLVFIIIFTMMIVFGCKKDDNNSNFSAGTMTDIEGNTYKTITIGTQTWMAENLRSTKYSNGDPIPNVTANTEWTTLATGAYCWYNNDITNKPVGGALYNWYVVTDSRSIAPTGWHIPTDAEWTVLVAYLGGENVAGGKMKEKGTNHWLSPNSGATNESGFTAIPSGLRYSADGTFVNQQNGYYWSSTEFDVSEAWIRKLYYNGTNCNRLQFVKQYGFAVRLIKD